MDTNRRRTAEYAKLPAPIKPIKAKEIALRNRYGVSQVVFARLLNVPKVTAISWEKGFE